MRLIKVLGLAAFSALAAMAVLGAGTASAVPHDRYGLCKAQELVLCAAGNLIPVGSGKMIGNATNPTLEGTLTETCEKGKIEGEITGELDEVGQLKGKITTVTFTNCKPCTEVTIENLPYTTELKMLPVAEKTILEYPWELIAKGTLKATLNKCVFGSGSCIFGAAEVISIIEMAETGATANTNKAPLEFKGGSLGEGFCGKIGNWNAKYALSWALTGVEKPDLAFPTLLGEV